MNGEVKSDIVTIKGGLSVVLKGDDGDSAYEVAVKNGFEGTEQEWLASLSGEADRAQTYTNEAREYKDSARDSAIEAGNHETAAKGYRDEAQAIKDGFAPEVAQATAAIRAEKAEAEAKKALVDNAATQAHLDRIQADADAEEVRYLKGRTTEEKNVATDAAERARLYAEDSAGAAQAVVEAALAEALPTKLDVDGTAVNAEKVNNHTVNTDVPANAVFTDTTYDAMTSQEAEAGTGTTSRVMTAKVLADYVAGALAALVNSAPGTLDTLKEIADALGDDPNFATTITTALSNKLGKNETAVNAAKVNNLTVETAVPSGAVFTDTTYSNATTEAAGLMSADDKTKLNGIASGAQVNSITGVKGDNEAEYRTGNVNITKGNIGLGNVDNTADSAKSVSHAATAGNADTVNNLTVQTAVPANAVFTDTTYDTMSAQDATTGTDTTGKLITAKVLADYVAGAIASLVASAPGTLDTLNELAAALGDDPNFATTMSTALAGKLGATETAVNAAKVNNLTVETAVPANAVFTDTVYTHPTTSGNKHIPAGGSSGQILRWSADGTAVWGTDNNTTYSNATTSAAGLMSATDKAILDGVPTTYATLSDMNTLATTATNSVTAAVNAKNDAVAAKNQAQSIADGLASIRDTAVDTSLTISGQAADSKTVGDKFDVIGATSATNNEYLCVWLDSANRVLFGVKADGSFYWQKGIPKVLKDELDAIKARLDALES